MWVDTRERMPQKDGFYLVQSVWGNLCGYEYTVAGGWNTFYTISDNRLSAESAIKNSHVVRWFEAPEPPAVPQEWEDEALEGGE